MLPVGAQCVVIIIRVVGVHSRFQSRTAGVGNGRRRQSLMEIQVVGGIDRLVRVGDGAGVIRQTIEQGRVDLQQPCGLTGFCRRL